MPLDNSSLPQVSFKLNLLKSISGCGRSLGFLAERKVRTPKGRIPRENGGVPGQPVATDSVTENKPPRARLEVRVKRGGKSSPLQR